jgi:hypothetical protein
MKLKNGECKAMKDIDLGDVLENGSTVQSVMKIDNKEKIPFYVINNAGVNGDNIYVTGSHLIFDKNQNKFIKVENYSKSHKTENIPEWFSCLITNDHKMQIGTEIFWDWEDHFVKTNYLHCILQ